MQLPAIWHHASAHTHHLHTNAHVMAFHQSTDCVLLFEWWHPTTTLQYVFSLGLIFCLCLLSEWLSFCSQRANLGLGCGHAGERMPLVGSKLLGDAFSHRTGVAAITFAGLRPLVLSTTSIGLGYALMLLTMTFNVGVFCTVVMGMSVGRIYLRAQPLGASSASRGDTEL